MKSVLFLLSLRARCAAHEPMSRFDCLVRLCVLASLACIAVLLDTVLLPVQNAAAERGSARAIVAAGVVATQAATHSQRAPTTRWQPPRNHNVTLPPLNVSTLPAATRNFLKILRRAERRRLRPGAAAAEPTAPTAPTLVQTRRFSGRQQLGCIGGCF